MVLLKVLYHLSFFFFYVEAEQFNELHNFKKSELVDKESVSAMWCKMFT